MPAPTVLPWYRSGSALPRLASTQANAGSAVSPVVDVAPVPVPVVPVSVVPVSVSASVSASASLSASASASLSASASVSASSTFVGSSPEQAGINARPQLTAKKRRMVCSWKDAHPIWSAESNAIIFNN